MILEVGLTKKDQQVIASHSSTTKEEKLQALAGTIAGKIRNLGMKVQLMHFQMILRSQGGKLNRIVDKRKECAYPSSCKRLISAITFCTRPN